jgi:hypothetical protein
MTAFSGSGLAGSEIVAGCIVAPGKKCMSGKVTSDIKSFED